MEFFFFYGLGGIFSQKLNKLRQEGMTSEFFTSHTQGAICSDLLSNFPLHCLRWNFFFNALGGIFSQKLNKLRQEGMTSEFCTSHTEGDICSDLLSNFPLHCLGYIRNIPVCCKKSSSLPLGE